jgi:PilZ domain-containing protein
VSAKFSLDGGMIPRSVKRMLDERTEERFDAEAQTAVLEFRGRKHVIRLVNTSPSGAMVIFSLVPHIGEQVSLQLLDRGQVTAKVRWVRDGRIGISFDEQRA